MSKSGPTHKAIALPLGPDFLNFSYLCTCILISLHEINIYTPGWQGCRLTGWLAGWQGDWLAGRVAGWQVGWLAGLPCFISVLKEDRREDI